MGPTEIIISAGLVLALFAAARFVTRNKTLPAESTLRRKLISTRRVGEFLGHPYLELNFEDGEEEGPIWAPRSFESRSLPWEFEASLGESTPQNSHLPALEAFQSRRASTTFQDKDGSLIWSDDGLNYEMVIDESWCMLVVRTGEEPLDSPALSFHVGEEMDEEVTLRVDSYQPVDADRQPLRVYAELYSEEEARENLAKISKELLQRIGEYCAFGSGEVIISPGEVLLDVFVAGFDAEFLEDIFRESCSIAHELLGSAPRENADEAW